MSLLMPLAFESLNRGTVAFGFFNIDSDMLLLERSFFFADDFCAALGRLDAARSDDVEERWDGYLIEDPGDVGDLMGAIRGTRHTGFIGQTYLRFPFPARPEEFRQKPEGEQNRQVFQGLIEGYGRAARIALATRRAGDEVDIAGYRFAVAEFHRLVEYVWVGGYPTWRGGQRPNCVEQMAAAVNESTHWSLADLALTR
jgi:hypothetical protein